MACRAHGVLIALAVLLGFATIAVAGGSNLVRASAEFQRLGDFRINRDPTLGGAVKAFGTPSNCRRIKLEDGSILHWNSRGIRILTATLGEVPAGETPCTYTKMPIAVITVTGRAWTTSFGLRVGDAVAKLRSLYPTAPFRASGRGDSSPSNSYWLVTRRTTCIGTCGTARYVTAPRLVAQTRSGRVVALIFPVGAQGE